MDHEQAVRTRAVERYLLDELASEEAEGFEAHFFECVECATELKATSQFLDRARTELRRSRKQHNVNDAKRVGRSWLDFLRNPALLAPGMAVLLAVILYQNLAVYPRLVRESALQQQPQILQPLSLIGAVSRGSSQPTATLGSHQELLLSLDIPTSDDSSDYTCLLLSESGKVLWRLPVSSAQARDTVQIRVPGSDLASGRYALVVQRRHGPKDGDELTRYPFNITRVH
jgi:hypothetical protein